MASTTGRFPQTSGLNRIEGCPQSHGSVGAGAGSLRWLDNRSPSEPTYVDRFVPVGGLLRRGIYERAERFGEAAGRQWLDGRSDRSHRRCGGGRHNSAHNPRGHPTNSGAGDVDHLHPGDAATRHKDYSSGDNYYIRSAASIDDDSGTVRTHDFGLPIGRSCGRRVMTDVERWCRSTSREADPGGLGGLTWCEPHASCCEELRSRVSNPVLGSRQPSDFSPGREAHHRKLDVRWVSQSIPVSKCSNWLSSGCDRGCERHFQNRDGIRRWTGVGCVHRSRYSRRPGD